MTYILSTYETKYNGLDLLVRKYIPIYEEIHQLTVHMKEKDSKIC